MPARRSWLCPTDADVQRFYEALDGISRARRQVLLILLLFSCAMTPWLGIPNLVLISTAAAVGFATDRLSAARKATVLSGVLVAAGFQVMLSFGVAITAGWQSPYLCWLTVPVTMLAARYRRAVVLVAVAVATGLGALACVIADHIHTGVLPPPGIRGVAVVALACALGAIALNLQSAEIESRRIACVDPLTGLLNRKALDSEFERLAGQAAAARAPLSALMLDLDHFKAVNDTHGHATGDDVLRQAAQLVQAAVRHTDRVYRVGGEEFLVLLPNTATDEATTLAERVRAMIAATPLAGLPITVSAGVATTPGHTVNRQELLEDADRALYTAKRTGRNQVIAHTTNPATAMQHLDISAQ